MGRPSDLLFAVSVDLGSHRRSGYPDRLPAAKRFGGSKQATTGSTVGLIVGMIFFPPFGLILGAFAGALIGELMHDKENLAKAFRVALSSFVAFVFGTGLKLAASLIMSWYVLRALF